jgi:hypothetical protein
MITVNSNGIKTAAKGKIIFFKLNPDTTYLNKREWPAPDEFVLSKSEFKKLFPLEPYENEHLIKNRVRTDSLFSIPFNTASKLTIDLLKD